MVPSLRAQIISVLEQAGYRHRETGLPVYPVGAFLVIGNDRMGASVTAQLWDGTEAELAALRAGIAEALRAAGLEVHESDTRIDVPPTAAD
jgi:hypothetical protein